MNNLKDIHNALGRCFLVEIVVYQDFNEQFEGYTQPMDGVIERAVGCYIRISMSKLKNFAAKLQKKHEIYKF